MEVQSEEATPDSVAVVDEVTVKSEGIKALYTGLIVYIEDLYVLELQPEVDGGAAENDPIVAVAEEQDDDNELKEAE
jgi:dUTPase